jgi:hypothetical protein
MRGPTPLTFSSFPNPDGPGMRADVTFDPDVLRTYVRANPHSSFLVEWEGKTYPCRIFTDEVAAAMGNSKGQTAPLVPVGK